MADPDPSRPRRGPARARVDAAGLASDATEMGIGILFERVSDGIVVSRSDGMIAFWNTAASRMFGYSAEEARGMNVDRLVPPEYLDRHRSAIAHYRDTGRGHLIESGRSMELPALRKDGERMWVDLALSRVDHGGEHYAIAVMRDATERVEARERTEAARRQALDAYASLESFSSVIAHDLKEPIRAIGTYLEILEEDPEAEDRAQLVARTLRAHRDLQLLLDGLLEWSRTASQPVRPRDVDLRKMLTSPGNAAQWEGLARERNARIEVARDLPKVRGTEPLLARIFGNLITNAIRHNDKEMPIVTIRGAWENGRRAIILVEDNGPGFPDHVVRQARAPGLPRSIRAGFGLAIARQAAHRLHGRIRIENAPDGGGRVRVELERPPTPSESALEERVRDLA